ncbi:MAG: pyridoxal 5'-phosphate synthase glutaminase subunit PdxT [Thermodesulfobacteriota bacterium]
MKIGVLALQGDFQEHELALRKIGVEAVEVRLPQDLDGLDGLIIPGGESTSIGKLATTFNLIDPLKQFAKTTPVWGTCGGLVFMAKDVGFDQPILGVLDMVVERNAFGRQVDSFEEDLDITGIEGGPFHGVFIRAPEVKEVGPSIEVLCRVEDGRIVAVRNGHLLATSFHPELTDDLRLHRYFVEIVAEKAR